MTKTALIRRFCDLIPVLNRGRFAEKLDNELATTLDTLRELPGEKGKATITVTLDIIYEGGRIDLKPSVKTKLPIEGHAATPFWEHEGALSVQHPSQIDMFSGPRDTEQPTRMSEKDFG